MRSPAGHGGRRLIRRAKRHMRSRSQADSPKNINTLQYSENPASPADSAAVARSAREQKIEGATQLRRELSGDIDDSGEWEVAQELETDEDQPFDATQAPPVVVVVVSKDPGDWFEETLAALGEQDYPNLAVLVLDADSSEPLAPRVAGVLPGAFVRRLEANLGYSANANEGMGMIEGASHLIFCHDDAAPFPDAVRLMVEEAYRSNAGIVAPKVVSWSDSTRILSVGMNADKGGAQADRVVPGELDQEQYDSVRDVFVAPGCFMLVRSDLFRALGGFDSEIWMFGEDLDICWRAQVLGARVIVAPAAKVSHIEITRAGTLKREQVSSYEDVRYLQRRNELRSVLKCYSFWHEVRVVPQLAVASLAEIVVSLIAGKWGRAQTVLRAWAWNLARIGQIGRLRRQIASTRHVDDSEVREMQTKGFSRVNSFFRRLSAHFSGVHQLAMLGVDPSDLGVPVDVAEPVSAFSAEEGGSGASGLEISGLELAPMDPELARHVTALMSEVAVNPLVRTRLESELGDGVDSLGLASGGSGYDLAGSERRFRIGLAAGLQGARASKASYVWLALALAYLVSVRSVLGSRIPFVGQLNYVPSAWHLLGSYISGGRGFPYSAATPQPTATGLLGIAGLLLAGSAAQVLKLVILLTIPAGVVGAFRFAGEFGDKWVRTAAALAYACLPLAAGSFSLGDQKALIAYAATPWLLFRLSVVPKRSIWVTGAIAGAAMAFVPAEAGLIALGVITFVAATPLVGSMRHLPNGSGSKATRPPSALVVDALKVIGIGAVLNFPWLLTFIGHWNGLPTLFGSGSPSSSNGSIFQVVSFNPDGSSPGMHGVWIYAPLIAAGLSVIIARGERFVWAVRLWMLAVACWTLGWLSSNGYLGASPVDLHVLLVPSALAIALLIAVGVESFRKDLSESVFGWRQLLSVVAAISGVLLVFNLVGFMGSGRFGIPSVGWETIFGGKPSERLQAVPSGNVLWVGNPAAIPSGSYPAGNGVSIAIDDSSIPEVSGQYTGAEPSKISAVATVLGKGISGLDPEIGKALSAEGISVVLVPTQLAPGGSAKPFPPPPWVIPALQAQLDLEQIQIDPSLDEFVVQKGTSTGPGAQAIPNRPGKDETVPLYRYAEELVQVAVIGLVGARSWKTRRVRV